MEKKPGQDEQGPGHETADGPVQQPADVGGELLRLGPGQQHAVVEGVQESVFADPPLLVDQDAVHDRDLAGGPAEAERRDPNPYPDRFRKRDVGCGHREPGTIGDRLLRNWVSFMAPLRARPEKRHGVRRRGRRSRAIRCSSSSVAGRNAAAARRRCRRLSGRPNLESLRSRSCTISAILRRAGSSMRKAIQHHLEGAPVPFVGEFRFVHVEPHLVGFRLVLPSRHKFEDSRRDRRIV